VERAETPGDPTSTVSTRREATDLARSATVWTIVVGGGSGRRFGRPKQYEALDHRRVIDVSRDVAAACSDGVVLVVPAADAEREGGVSGGATRSASVRAGLAAVPDAADVICVHDAARPLASADIYRRVIDAVLDGADAAIPAIAVNDTIKTVDRSVDATADVWGSVVDTHDRDRLVAVQTPQAFRADRLRAAHRSGSDATDDAGLVEAAGGVVVVVRGDPINRKITEPDDLAWARGRLAAEAER
jgi:2-C-methyl-D-erythritol 4-phosphate cytidylyltransferase